MHLAVFISIASILPSFWAIPTEKNITVNYFLDWINSKQTSWRAGKYFITNTTLKTLTRSNTHIVFNEEPGVRRKRCILEDVIIPETFDARTQWPECADIIGKIGSQGLCNSCWAFAATQVMSDRLCIQTGGKVKFEFSPQDLVSCCPDCGHGCTNGVSAKAWDYYVRSGIVSGGGFTSLQGCKPYQESEYYYNRSSTCSEKCDNPYYEVPYAEDKKFGSEYYLVEKTAECIQAEIMQNGPVQASFALYEDFPFYKDGVYVYTVGRRKNVHAVRLLGWGTENGVPYWLAANSWNCLWGSLKGFFKIRRGYDECAIEQHVIAGNPKLDDEILYNDNSTLSRKYDEMPDEYNSTSSIPIWAIMSIVVVCLLLITIAAKMFGHEVKEVVVKYLRFQ